MAFSGPKPLRSRREHQTERTLAQLLAKWSQKVFSGQKLQRSRREPQTERTSAELLAKWLQNHIVSGPKAPARQRGTSNCRSCSPSAGQMASNYQMFKPKGPSKTKGKREHQTARTPNCWPSGLKIPTFSGPKAPEAEGSAKLKELSHSCWPTGLKMPNFQRPQQCRREPRARFRGAHDSGLSAHDSGPRAHVAQTTGARAIHSQAEVLSAWCSLLPRCGFWA